MNLIIWAVLWGVAGLLLGILIFFVAGLFSLPLSATWRNRPANYYSALAMKFLKRAALVESGTKYDIYRTSNSPDTNSDTMTIDGEDAEITNATGLLSTLHKRPFGLVPPPDDNVAVYVSPELAELGKVEKDRIESNEHLDDDGEYESTVTLPERRPTATLREYAGYLVPGNRSVWDLSETIELYKQSQSMFGSSKTTQYMILIIAYGAAALLTWLIVTNAGGSMPDAGTVIPGLVVGL